MQHFKAALFDAVREKAVRAQEKGAQAIQPGLWLLKQWNESTLKFGPVPEVAVMRVPTMERYAVPLYLDWGGWDAAAPSSYELAAVARHWQETHGAHLVALGSDQIEFTVARKPTSHAELVALLKEHYAFAPDNRVFDYDWSDRGLLEWDAAELRGFDMWDFWW